MTTLATFHGGPLDGTTDDLPTAPERVAVAIWTPLPCWSPDIALACRVGSYAREGEGASGVRYVYRGSRSEVPV
jgi:hypothetical protein